MSTARPSARERILDLAEAAVLQKGYGATSIEELIAGAGITKSGFFYHFREKNDLARSLLERDFERDEAILDQIFAEAEARHDDPLESFLEAYGRFANFTAAGAPGVHAGCLMTSFSYEEGNVDPQVGAFTAACIVKRTERFYGKLQAIAERHPPKEPVDLYDLAAMALAVVQGGIIINKVMKDPQIAPQQTALFSTFVRAVFGGS